MRMMPVAPAFVLVLAAVFALAQAGQTPILRKLRSSRSPWITATAPIRVTPAAWNEPSIRT